MTQTTKKKRKKKESTNTSLTNDTQKAPVHTFEIRKFIKARDIVEAMNLDVQTPPSYLVMVEEDEMKEEPEMGFKSNEE